MHFLYDKLRPVLITDAALTGPAATGTMNKSFSLLCLTLACCAGVSPAISANRSASFDASLTIVESCRIDAAASAAPVVACQMATPAAVSRMGATASAAESTTGGVTLNPAWMVSF